MDVTTDVNKQFQIWTDSDLNWIGNALGMYRAELQKADGQGNEVVKSEIGRVSYAESLARRAKAVKEFDRQPGLLSFSPDQLSLIKAVLLKYEQFLRFDIAESKKTATVRGQTEGKEKWLSAVNDLLAGHVAISTTEPGQLLVSTFLPRKSEHPTIQPAGRIIKKVTNVNIGKVITRNFVGINQGTLIQNDDEAIEALGKLLGELKSSELSDSQKALAAAHVTMIQVQLTQPKPDSGVIKKSFEVLGNLVNLVQAKSITEQALHWLQTAMTFISTHQNLVDKIRLPVA